MDERKTLPNYNFFTLQSINVPWKSILTSGPVWAVIFANFTADWGMYTILICLPKYFFEVLHFDLAKVRKYRLLKFTKANIDEICHGCLAINVACFWGLQCIYFYTTLSCFKDWFPSSTAIRAESNSRSLGRRVGRLAH